MTDDELNPMRPESSGCDIPDPGMIASATGMRARDPWEMERRRKRITSCDGCKFWSELCAAQLGGEEMKALCLNPESHRYQKMVEGGCDKYEAGRSIDDPSR